MYLNAVILHTHIYVYLLYVYTYYLTSIIDYYVCRNLYGRLYVLNIHVFSKNIEFTLQKTIRRIMIKSFAM